MTVRLALSLSIVGLLLAAPPARGATTACSITFSLAGWSIFYKTASGTGTVHCDNGQSARVTIRSAGGGFTFGRSRIDDGRGRFSPVADIDEVFGSYAMAEAHAGMGPSASARALTKGTVSLELSGTGQGIDVGFAFGDFRISRAE